MEDEMNNQELEDDRSKKRELLISLLEKTKLNEEKIPKEELLGKYRTAYLKLLGELKEAANAYIFEQVFQKLYIKDEQAKECHDVFQKIIMAKQAGITQAVSVLKDIEILDLILEETNEEVVDAWFEICCSSKIA